MSDGWAGYRWIADDGQSGRRWWDVDADTYLATHGAFLGERDLLWCPEGLREDDVHLLGEVAGRDLIEVGCGAAQGSRWVSDNGGRCVGIDISAGMLAHHDDADVVLADARALPFADASFDVAFTAFGAIAFVPDPDRIHREVARVLRAAGRWVFSVPHPVLWGFPPEADSPAGLTAERSYFDRTPYVELDGRGMAVYAEYHHTIGDHIRAVAAAGFRLLDLVEPEWTAGTTTWEGWSERRAEVLPGTAIFVCELSAPRRTS